MSTSTKPSTQGPGLRGYTINGCSVNIDHADSHQCQHQGNPNVALPLPTALSLFYNPERNLAFFRLRTLVSLQVDAETRAVPFFLHIPPDKIDVLSLCQHDNTTDITEAASATGHSGTIHPPAKTCLRFFLVPSGSVSIVAPRSLPAGNICAANSVACNTLGALRLLAQQAVIYISLPPAALASGPAQLTALCQAVSTSGRLQPDPVQANLRSLYRGEGGRVVELEELAPFLSSDRPPPSLFACQPPAYPDDASDGPPLPPLTPGLKQRQHKRLRSRSPSPSPSPTASRIRDRSPSRSRSRSRSSSSTPRYRTWQHLNLAVGEREKMMAELLRRTEKKEKTIEELLRRVDEKEERLSSMLRKIDEERVRVADETRKLTALIASSRDCRLSQKEQRYNVPEPDVRAGSQACTASQAPTGPPGPSATAASDDQGSTVSASTDVSDRVQAYISTQLDGLREEMHALRQTMDKDVDLLIDQRLDDFVKEEDMFDAIRAAVDDAVAGIRDKVLDAWI